MFLLVEDSDRRKRTLSENLGDQAECREFRWPWLGRQLIEEGRESIPGCRDDADHLHHPDLPPR
jgi:hypothetical protein